MPLPEYVQTWLTGFDESPEPVDCSMISLNLYTRLAERQSKSDEVKATFRVLAPLEFHIRPRGGSPWNSYFAPKHEGTDLTGGDPHYPNLSDLDAAAVEEWAALADSFRNPALKARFCILPGKSCLRIMLFGKVDEFGKGIGLRRISRVLGT